MFKRFSDTDIIEGVKRQDVKILNWLYDNYFSMVKKWVINNNGTADEVADVFQDTIIVLYNQIKDNSLNLNSDLKGYFFGIARNVWNVQLRRKKKLTEMEIDLPDETYDTEDNELILEKIVSRSFLLLKPDQQLVMKLFSEGCSYQEIAEKMQLNSEEYARRKKYLSKEALLDIIKEDPEYQEYLNLRTKK